MGDPEVHKHMPERAFRFPVAKSFVQLACAVKRKQRQTTCGPLVVEILTAHKNHTIQRAEQRLLGNGCQPLRTRSVPVSVPKKAPTAGGSDSVCDSPPGVLE